MPEHLFIARLFLWGGCILAGIGLVLWLALPIHGAIPPYLVTALLAIAYGWFCRRPKPPASVGKS